MSAPLRRITSVPRTSERSGDDAERTWVAGVREGDEAAFDAIFGAYYQVLCRFATGIVGSPDTAEDVVQGVFVAIWDLRESWEVRQPLRVYLYTAVRNRAIQVLRKQRNRARLTALRLPRVNAGAATTDTRTADRELEHAELADRIELAVADLPARGRQAYQLHRDHGLTYDEIAEVMGISPKTVSVHIGRALLSLRKALAPYLAPAIALLTLR
jgi:RNA polymerase sigma-70 factor (family 1)